MNAPRQTRRAAATVLWACLLCLGATTAAVAQQPFLVDDAEVAPSRLWHVEVSSQVDLLRPAVHGPGDSTLDASVLGGWLDASPRFGVQIGMSIDLR